MRTTVKMPRAGDSDDDIVVVEWYVGVGQEVAAGDPLVRVETSKVEVDVPSPVAGRVAEVLAEADADVAVGAALCVLES